MIRHILHPSDLSYCAEASLPMALTLARRQGAALHVLHVGPELSDDPIIGPSQSGPDMEALYARQNDLADNAMKLMLEAHGADGVQTRRVHVRGTPADEILAYAAAEGADLIVMGTHGRRGIRQLLLGSVAQEVMRRATIPVLVVRTPPSAPITAQAPRGNVLAAVDFSPASLETIQYAAMMAGILGSSVELLHIVDPVLAYEPETEGSMIERILGRAEQELLSLYAAAGVDAPLAGAHVQLGYPPFEITEFVRQHSAAMVVLGRQGMSQSQLPSVGLTADYVVRAVGCPVVVVPACREAIGGGDGFARMLDTV